MLQQEKPEDFVIGTGETHSVREFVQEAFKYVGKEIVWEGEGVNEVGKEKDTGVVRVKVDPKYFRPTDVVSCTHLYSRNRFNKLFLNVQCFLLSDPKRAKEKFGWAPKVTFLELVKEMMESDINLMKRNPMA